MTAWADYVAAWSSPPVDDVGYRPATELLALSDTDLMSTIIMMRKARYQGWRNEGGAWRELMGHHSLAGLNILDYGCGTGIEAIDLARRNRVSLADISTDNIELAIRVMGLFGAPFYGSWLIGEHPPYVEPDHQFDVIYACGVLHHCRHPRPVLGRWWELLREGGQARVLLYTAGLWREATGSEPPSGDVEDHAQFTRFVRYADGVGDYADWYDQARLERRVDGLFTVERCAELGQGRLLAATLRRID